jgi:hypothetical protein
MANVIEFLRHLLSDTADQEAYRADPSGYLTAHGFDDLAGEDVVEALPLVRARLDELVAAELPASLPPTSPGPEETELDAARRQIDHLLAGPEPAADEPADIVDEEHDEGGAEHHEHEHEHDEHEHQHHEHEHHEHEPEHESDEHEQHQQDEGEHQEHERRDQEQIEREHREPEGPQGEDFGISW